MDGGKHKTQALAMGLGSLFNHSSQDQNVGWVRNIETECIVYTSLRSIQAGEELCINYGRLWFKDADEHRSSVDDGERNPLDGIQLVCALSARL